jgi:hypothetical protein
MKNPIINASSTNLFLITFADKSTDNNFITDSAEIGNVLKWYNTTKVKSIKLFNIQKQKFEPITKKLLNQLTSYNTDSNLQLKALNLI